MTFKRILQRIQFYTLSMFLDLIEYINTVYYMHCKTSLLKKFGMQIIGNPKYIHKTVKFDDFNKITLYDNIVISFGVYFLTHDYSRLVGYNILRSNKYEFEDFDNPLIGKIIIGANSFIGCRCLLLPNTYIGKNCIIGAGSVVKGKFPDGSVVCGNPAKIIGTIEQFGHKWLNQHLNETSTD